MSREIVYYELLREEDEHLMFGIFFKNMQASSRGGAEDEWREFPPKPFCHVVVFDNIFNYCRTLEVQSVEKISEDKYRFYTFTNTYTIRRVRSVSD